MMDGNGVVGCFVSRAARDSTKIEMNDSCMVYGKEKMGLSISRFRSPGLLKSVTYASVI